jgi:ADP-ribose pyrophosphatase YjhB (NUDIX family)
MKAAGILCRHGDKILLVQKNYTLAFAHFIVGFYKTPKDGHALLQSITKTEKDLLINTGVSGLAIQYFGAKTNIQHFNDLLKYLGVTTIAEQLNKMTITRTEPNWEIPKGKKKDNESDFDCAKRELVEETGVLLAYNHKITRDGIWGNTHYYLVDIKDTPDNLCPFDKKEIKNVSWFDYLPAVTYETKSVIQAFL